MSASISRRWLLGAGGVLALTLLSTRTSWTQTGRATAITVYKNPT